MPELPEVETVRLGITPFALNQIIEKMIVRNRKMRWRIPDGLEKKVRLQKIIRITRRAKYLLLTTEIGTIIIHLGMSGVLSIVEKNTPLKKHDHVDIKLSNHKIIRLNDTRRFGCVLWEAADPLTHRLLKNLAPEPLSQEFDVFYLSNGLKNKKVMIKKAIMNNQLVVGVGNIYASEVLFEAKISPFQIADKLSFEQLETLIKSIKKILKEAIKLGGTTLKDFRNVDGQPGYFAQDLKVYGRNDEQCVLCNTTIKKTMISNRATYFCTLCQA